MKLLRSSIVQYCAVELLEILGRKSNRRNEKLFLLSIHDWKRSAMTRETLFKSLRPFVAVLRDKTQGQRHWMDDRER